MGSDNINLITNTYYKGNSSSCKEFTILQDSKSPVFIISIILSAILLNCYYLSSNVYWQSTVYVILTLLIGIFIIYTVLFTVKDETVLLVVPLALQLKTTYLSGRETIRLIPWHLLGNLMILDIIVGQQVLFYLAIEVKMNDSSKHIILFRHSRPRLKYLERIYKDLQEILDVNR